jgi:hypothetical protein
MHSLTIAMKEDQSVTLNVNDGLIRQVFEDLHNKGYFYDEQMGQGIFIPMSQLRYIFASRIAFDGTQEEPPQPQAEYGVKSNGKPKKKPGRKPSKKKEPQPKKQDEA